MIDTRISHYDEARFFERSSDVVGEGSGGKTTSNGLGTGIGSKFEDCTVSVRASRDNAYIIRILDGCNDTSSKDEFLPCFPNVQEVNPCEINRSSSFGKIHPQPRTISPSFPDVRLHLLIAVFR